MPCEQWRGKLDAYVDGELAPDEVRTVASHLRGCAPCANAVLERVQMKRSVQVAGRRFAPSAELRNRISRSFAAKPTRKAAWLWILAVPALSVIIISVGTESLRSARQRTPPDRLQRTGRPARRRPSQRGPGRCRLHRPAHREAVVSGKNSLHVQSAGAARDGVHLARRPRHLFGTNARGAFDLSAAQARDFGFHFSRSRR